VLVDTRNEGSKTRIEPRQAAFMDPDFDGDFPQAAPVRRNPSKKIEQMTGHKINNGVSKPEELAPETSQRHGTSQEQIEIKTVNGTKYAVAPEVAVGNYGQERAARGPGGHHHLTNIAHQRRSQYQPGDGLYAPHRPLQEWKNGSIGALTGELLDLDVRQTEAEKDKAWWEAGHSGKRKVSASKKPKIEAYDGENENSNGMVFPTFSGSDEDYSPFVSSIGAQTWLKIQHPVVPLARLTIGYRGNTKAEARRRNKVWPMEKNPLRTKA
jgi:hypothetical protein